MKRTISFTILVLLFVLSVSAYDVQIDTVYYKFANNEAIVTSNGYDSYADTIIIPSSIEYEGVTYPVTSIEDNAFGGSSRLTMVEIPKSIKSIGQFAFEYCTGLTSLEIPNSVTTIGHSAFSYCTSLKSVVLSSSITLIDEYLFYDCSSLESITIPNGVKTINESAFRGCKSLSSIVIPNGVTSFGNRVFYDCSSLTSLVIPNSVKSFGYKPFANCDKLETLSIDLEYVDSWFKNLPSLKTLVLGDHVETIGEEAFAGCLNLKSLNLPKGLKTIGIKAFYECERLTELTIPNHVTEIGEQAFYGCKGLTKLLIEDGKETLFFSSTSVANTFVKTSLKEIYLGRNIYYFNYSPFGAMEMLTTITIGEEVKKLPDMAFLGSSQLMDVFIYTNSIPVTGESIFTESYQKNATLHVPYSIYDEIKVLRPWGQFGKIINYEGLYNLTYLVDGEKYKNFVIKQYTAIEEKEEEPEKEGNTFSGWSEIPEIMPDHDVEVIGSFITNTYQLTWMIGDEIIQIDSVLYGDSIVVVEAPYLEGYEFAGWIDLPETMPDHDVVITGRYTDILAIGDIMAEDKWKQVYSVGGQLIVKPRKGLNIIKKADGKTVKVMIK